MHLAMLKRLTIFGLAGLSLLASVARAETVVTIDDFEKGVGNWTRNDKVKSDTPSAGVLLVDIASTAPGTGGKPGSNGAALFVFKSATKSWASASTRVDGAAWAKAGTQRLSFWINAGGNKPGVALVLRARVPQGNGKFNEVVYQLPKPIRLDERNWRKVVIPIADFKSPAGAITKYMSNIYLLQFVQTDTWDSRFFTIDDLQIEGSGIPLQAAAPAAKPTPVPAAAVDTAPDEGGVKVNVDYLKVTGRIRPSGNITVGATQISTGVEGNHPLSDSAAFRTAVKTLKPRFIRLDAAALVALTDSSRPAFDFTQLRAAVEQTWKLDAEPLIAFMPPAHWGLDQDTYTQFVAQSVQAVNGRAAKPVRFFELATGAAGASDADAVAYYNSARAAIKKLSATYRVGGITASSGRTNALNALLKGAAGLDFLTLQHFGSMAGKPTDADLFKLGREVSNVKRAATALDASRWRSAPIYLTSNLNASSEPGDTVPSDGRTVQMISAAWWASYMGNVSRLADQVFHNDGANPEWGLLDEGARAYPAYYALWLWNSFLPPGSERALATTATTGLAAFAVNTPTAHNLLLVNTTDAETTAQITIRGFPVLREARIRVFDDPNPSDPNQVVRFEQLPKSPFQTIKLKPYAVAVLQFIEPPKKR